MRYSSVVVKGGALSDGFEPDELPCRGAELELIHSWLSRKALSVQPRHVWLFGPSGAGKTCVARHVMRRWAREHAGEAVYVNCWQCNTLYKASEYLVDRIGILLAEKQQTEFKLERIRRSLAGRPFLVVLDEIEQALPRNRAEIVRGLLGLGGTSLLCVSRSVEPFYHMDEGTMSRLSPRMVGFGPYPGDALVEVLRERADAGLAEGAWTDAVLRHTASLARGDARDAIRMLRVAAQMADEQHAPVIREPHVERAWQNVKDTPMECILGGLTPDHRILYEVVRRQGSATSGELYAAYEQECRQAGRLPIAVRTSSNYANRLVAAGLLTSERARLRGRTRLFRVAEDRTVPPSPCLAAGSAS